MPRSLLARTFLAIGAVLVLAMTAWFALVRAYEYEPRALAAARTIVSLINLTRSALISAQPDLRRALLTDLADSEGIRVYPFEADDRLSAHEPSAFTNRVVALVRETLGPATRFAASRDGQVAFWVSFHIDQDDEYWIAMDPDRLNPPLTRQLIGWAALALALALAGAYAIVYRLKPPLSALARAASTIGRGKHPAPLQEQGPEELRTVAAAFNQMTRDLARLDQDRAIVVAGVSHDLRTPLARMRLAIEMAGVDAATREGMAMDIDEMDRIIGQFLDFARLDPSDPLDPVDVALLAQDVARGYVQRQHDLRTHIAAMAPAYLRAMAIRRLLTNLIDNAFRYAGGTVELNVSRADQHLTIEVLDRGNGIPASETERLKQPFQRLESARSNASGSGLGLAIVERITRMHGGRFDLLERPGGGLIARVTLALNAA